MSDEQEPIELNPIDLLVVVEVLTIRAKTKDSVLFFSDYMSMRKKKKKRRKKRKSEKGKWGMKSPPCLLIYYFLKGACAYAYKHPHRFFLPLLVLPDDDDPTIR